METRIMFLIVLLLVLWLIFSEKGKEIIARVTGSVAEAGV